MARTNLNTKGSVRCEVIGGPDIQFVADTNSGLFASIVYNGVGLYILNYARPVAPSDQLQLQLEGTAPGSLVSNRVDSTTEAIAAFNAAGNPAPAEQDFSAVMFERFVG